MPRVYEPPEAIDWVVSVPLPADGEKASEGNFAPAWEACAKREQYLYRRLPRVYSASYENVGVALWTYANSYNLETTVTTTNGYVEVPDCVIGDVIRCTCFLNFERAGSNRTVDFDAYLYAFDAYGDAGQVSAAVTGAHFDCNGLDADIFGTGIYQPLALAGSYTVTVAGTTRVAFALDSDNWSSDTFKIISAFTLQAIRFPV